MNAFRTASVTSDAMNCCISQPSQDATGSGLAVPSTVATTAKDSLAKLIAALDPSSPLQDRSLLLKLARDAREVMQACMQPLPPCQEAVFQIRELIQKLISGKQAEEKAETPPEDCRDRRAPVLSLEIADADWEYLPDKALDLGNKIHQAGPPWNRVLTARKAESKAGNIIKLDVPSEYDRDVLRKSLKTHPERLTAGLALSIPPRVREDIYLINVYNIRYPFGKTPTRYQLGKNFHVWGERNHITIVGAHFRNKVLQLQVTGLEQARKLLQTFFIHEGRSYPVSAWDKSFDRQQCFNCFTDNHQSKDCTKPRVCVWCAEDHDFKTQCSKERSRLKCAICGGPHRADSEECQDVHVKRRLATLKARRMRGASWIGKHAVSMSKDSRGSSRERVEAALH